MPTPVPTPWLPRLLFRITVAMAAGLMLLVFLSPWLDDADGSPAGARRLLRLFAREPVVRRTAVASALGLGVTACVFFRPPRGPRRLSKRDQPAPPPPSVVGA